MTEIVREWASCQLLVWESCVGYINRTMTGWMAARFLLFSYNLSITLKKHKVIGCHRDQVENGSRCWICKGSDRASEQKNSQNTLSTKEAHFNESDSPQDKFYYVLVMMNNHDNFTKNTSKSRPFTNFECLCTFYTHKPSLCTVRDPMPLGLL